MEKICIHCYVSGKVQGVWFRAGAQQEATRLGLTGWVRNLPGGQVEVLACGERNQIEVFHDWLQNGPELAKVTEVVCEELPWKEYGRFDVV